MSELPKEWSFAPLMENVDLHDSRRIPLNQTERAGRQGPFPYYGANGQVDSINDYIFDGEFILLAEDGGYFDDPARCVAYEVAGKFWVNNHAHILSPKNGIPRRYLTYALNQLDWISYVGGSTRLKLTQEGMRRIYIPLAPPGERERVVAKLDSLFKRSKSAREELIRIPRLVERYKEAILAAAFRGELTGKWRTQRAGTIETASSIVARTLAPTQPRGGREAAERVIPGIAALSVNDPGTPAPAGWSWVPLTRIARQETGHTPSRSHPEWWSGDIRWIGIKDAHAHHGTVITDTLQTTNAEGLANSAARILPAGTVCLSRTASVGYVVIMGRPMATSQDFVTWSCTEALLPKFLMYALMAEGDDIRRFGKGSTHTTIYFPEVRALHICLAPIEEQQVIVECIETAIARVDKIAAEARRATELLDRLDQATLGKAFKGALLR